MPEYITKSSLVGKQAEFYKGIPSMIKALTTSRLNVFIYPNQLIACRSSAERRFGCFEGLQGREGEVEILFNSNLQFLHKHPF